MRFTLLSLAACIFATALAQSVSTANPPTVSSDFSITAGKPATLTWRPTTQGPVTLTLRSGAASDLNKGTVIAAGVPNLGSYTFTLPKETVRNSDYTIEISSDSDPKAVNYTPQFVVESSNTVASITPASSMATSASSASTKASSAASSMSTARPMSSMSTATGSRSASSMGGTSTASSGSGSSAAATSAPATAPASGASGRRTGYGLVVVMLGVVAVL